MYNNYWNPNQDVMYPNAVPNVGPNNPYYHAGRNNIFDSSNFNDIGFNNNQIQHQTYPTNNELKSEYRIDLELPQSGMGFQGDDLGNGFYRFAWENRSIGARQILPVSIHAGPLKVISAGYGIQNSGNAILVESYPKDQNNWYMTVQNLVDAPRKIAFYLIAKQ
ncbi:TPA: hypothetical protein ACGXP7_001921 [Bacillus cereus]|uniref:hypothetical protein n=1 Tax=Bacillus sp. ISO11 TaxID=1826752 RepID=UPI000E5167FD|nr:hypothetical protein [Bacillus sp. ISO11]RGP97355.1 hypothetical protein D1166_24665 [Bacillus sp. ISO11]